MLQTAVLFLMYITAIGFGMIFFGIVISNAKRSDIDLGDFEESYNLLYAGGILSTVSWVSLKLNLASELFS